MDKPNSPRKSMPRSWSNLPSPQQERKKFRDAPTKKRSGGCGCNKRKKVNRTRKWGN